MDAWNGLLVEVFEEVVAAYAPEPEECGDAGGDEQDGEEENERKAGDSDDEEHGAEEGEDYCYEEGEDGYGAGEDKEDADGGAGEGDVRG